MKKLYRIFMGWYYFLTNQKNELSRERLMICVDCPKMSKGLCTSCGCVLQSKARIEEEECPLGKWPHLHKWKSRNVFVHGLHFNGKKVNTYEYFECDCGAKSTLHHGSNKREVYAPGGRF